MVAFHAVQDDKKFISSLDFQCMIYRFLVKKVLKDFYGLFLLKESRMPSKKTFIQGKKNE